MSKIDCREVAEAIDKETLEILGGLDYVPSLAIVRKGDNPDDEAYINAILRKAAKLGIYAGRVDDGGVLDLHRYTGIVGVSCKPYMTAFQDVDGLYDGGPFAPCTAEAIIRILKHFNVEMKGARTTVVGRGKRVGAPVAKMLLDEDATVTVCHSKTHERDLSWHVSYADDILVTAVGCPGFLDAPIDPWAVVIDAGMGVDEDGKLRGDVPIEGDPMFSYIGPMEVGRVTTSVLLNHVAKAVRRAI